MAVIIVVQYKQVGQSSSGSCLQILDILCFCIDRQAGAVGSRDNQNIPVN